MKTNCKQVWYLGIYPSIVFKHPNNYWRYCKYGDCCCYCSHYNSTVFCEAWIILWTNFIVILDLWYAYTNEAYCLYIRLNGLQINISRSEHSLILFLITFNKLENTYRVNLTYLALQIVQFPDKLLTSVMCSLHTTFLPRVCQIYNPISPRHTHFHVLC